jgi:hypothetical protein
VDVDEHPPDFSRDGGGISANVDFGVREGAEDLMATLSDLITSVGKAIQSAVTEAASLRVVTYTSDDLEAVTLDRESGRFTGSARLRAVTRLSIDGDTLLCLPESDGEVDDGIWAIHSQAVANAQAYRADLLKAVLAAASGLFPSLR